MFFLLLFFSGFVKDSKDICPMFANIFSNHPEIVNMFKIFGQDAVPSSGEAAEVALLGKQMLTKAFHRSRRLELSSFFFIFFVAFNSGWKDERIVFLSSYEVIP